MFFSPPLFVDGGRGLITYGGKGGLTWRAVETGAEVRTLDSPELSGSIAATELSPDGRYLAVSRISINRIVRLFDVATGRPVGPVLEHKNTVFSVAFSPDSRMLLTGSSDNTARLWAVPGGEPLARPLDLHRTVKLVAFAPDGRSLATQDGDLVRLWALPEDGVPMTRVPLDGNNSFAALSPDGALTIPTGMSFASQHAPKHEGLSRRDRPTGRAAPPPRGPDRRRGLLARRAIGRHPRRTRGSIDGGAGGRGLGLVERPIGDGGRRCPPSRGACPTAPTAAASPCSAAAGSCWSSTPTTAARPSAGAPTTPSRPHHWVNNGKVALQPRRPERADLGDGE